MNKFCYVCNTYMGRKYGDKAPGIFHSICDQCSDMLKIEERLPELLLAIVELRKRNGNKDYDKPLETLVTLK
jgi:hypothetical protein